MNEEIAVIVLPTVLYRSGQILDMERLTKEAHARGIMIGFDACHSVGAIPHKHLRRTRMCSGVICESEAFRKEVWVDWMVWLAER